MSKTYVAKTSKFEAIQLTDSNVLDVREFCGVHPRGHGYRLYTIDDIFYMVLENNREIRVHTGDYIIKGSDSDYSVIPQIDFENRYEELQ